MIKDIPNKDISEPERFINIGSGPRQWPGWICLDELQHPGVTTFKLSEHSVFPVADSSIELAYSSHNLEHLNDASAAQVLSEVQRCLSNSGCFLLKMPDFDWFLAEYRAGNLQVMVNKGVESALWSWKNYQFPDNLENRLAMMYCSYWNHSYGDHYSGNVNHNDTAYHGPARMEWQTLYDLLQNASIRTISQTMNAVALADPDFKCFNHCNAWSRSDLISLVARFGLREIAMNKNQIISKYEDLIPDLHNISDWSLYLVLEKSIEH